MDISQLNTGNRAGNKPDKSTGLLNKEISLFKSKPDNKFKEQFYHRLSILIGAGIDIRTALEIVAESQKKKPLNLLITGVKEDIINGLSMSEALKKTGFFSDYEYYSLMIGEESGKTVRVLEELGIYFQNKIKQKRRIVSALSYPAVVFCTSFGAVFFMLNFVVPMFADVFKRFGGDLPAVTVFIMSMSAWFKKYALSVLFVIITTVLIIYKFRNHLVFKKISSKIIIKTPFLGDLIVMSSLTSFAKAMSMMLSSGVSLTESLALVRKMVSFYPLQIAILDIEQKIINGDSLNNAMSGHNIFPRTFVSLIKVGEEVNKMGDFFDKTAEQYAEETEHKSALLGSVIEPIMIIFLGLMVGLILIAMYLPLFKLGSSFG